MGVLTRPQKQFANRVQLELPDLRFFVLSDVWLDRPDTLLGLRKMFDNCMENSFIPKIIVLCGNFTSTGIPQGNGREVRKYQGEWAIPPCNTCCSKNFIDNFDALADLIASYPVITRTTHFILVPGPLDVTVNSVLPRRPILPSFLSRMRNRVPNVHFATNPCRIKFFEQEIVIFREDLMSRMLRNLVGVKPDVKNDDLKRYVCAQLARHCCRELTLELYSSYKLYSTRATSCQSRHRYSPRFPTMTMLSGCIPFRRRYEPEHLR